MICNSLHYVVFSVNELREFGAIEQFLTECYKTTTKIITLANMKISLTL